MNWVSLGVIRMRPRRGPFVLIIAITKAVARRVEQRQPFAVSQGD